MFETLGVRLLARQFWRERLPDRNARESDRDPSTYEPLGEKQWPIGERKQMLVPSGTWAISGLVHPCFLVGQAPQLNSHSKSLGVVNGVRVLGRC